MELSTNAAAHAIETFRQLRENKLILSIYLLMPLKDIHLCDRVPFGYRPTEGASIYVVATLSTQFIRFIRR